MIKRIISCVISTVLVLAVTIGYDRTPACRLAVMEQVPPQLGSVLPRAASYSLELTAEEQSRTYTVNCIGKDGNTFRSYSMLTMEGSEEPLHYTYTDYSYDEAGNCTEAATFDKDGQASSALRRTFDEKNRVLRTENYSEGELISYSESVYTEVTNGQSSAVTTLYDADGYEQCIIRTGMNTNGDILSSRLYEGEDNVTASTDNRYDSRGRLIQSLSVDENEIATETLYVYSIDGKRQTSRSTCEGETFATEQRVFDENDRPLSTIQKDGDGYTISITYSYFS